MIDWFHLMMIKDCLSLPDGSKLKEGTYHSGPKVRSGKDWLVTTPDVASIFETCAAGFAPSPCDKFSHGRY